MDTQSITFEFDDQIYLDDSEYENFDSASYLNRICQKTMTDGLDREHSRDFKKLSNFLKSKSSSELVTMYNDAKSKCELAR